MTEKLYTTNKKVIDFYKKYTSFDFDSVNLNVVNMLEHIVSDTENKLSSSAITQIYSMLNDYNKKVDVSFKNMELYNRQYEQSLSQFKSHLDSHKHDIINNVSDVKDSISVVRELIMNQKNDIENIIVSKLSSVKQQYVDDIKLLLNYHEQNSATNIKQTIDNVVTNLMDKINNTIRDIMPKINEPIHTQLQNNIEQFKSFVTVETLKLHDKIHTGLQSINNTELLNSFISNFNYRYSELIKGINEPIISYVTCSEERIKNNIDNTSTRVIDTLKSNLNTDLILSALNSHDKTDVIKSFINNEVSTILTAIGNSSSVDNIKQIMSSYESRVTDMIQSVQNPILHTINTTEDRLSKNMEQVKNIAETSQSIIDTTNKNLTDHLNKYKNSSAKGQISEYDLMEVVNSIFPDGEINNTTSQKKNADLLLVRSNKPKIRFENKHYTTNVPEAEVTKFIRDILHCKDSHGIFISQISGIANRQDYHIEIHNGFIILFLHSVNYDKDKIKMAVNVIDRIDDIINSYNANNSDTSKIIMFDQNDIDKLNYELATHIATKQKTLQQLDEYHQTMKKQIQSIDIPYLHKIMSEYNGIDPTNSVHQCDQCERNFSTKRALSMHKMHIHKKQTSTSIESTETTSISSNSQEATTDIENVSDNPAPVSLNIQSSQSDTVTEKPKKGRRSKQLGDGSGL
jgi:hypothetical protein